MTDFLLPPYILQEQILIFACWSIIIFFFKKTKFISTLDISIIWLIRIVGIVYFLQFPVIFCADWLSGEYVQYTLVNRITGPYWFPAVFSLLVYLFSTQSLWFAHFRKPGYWRIIFGVLIFSVTFINDIVLWIDSFQSDFNPSLRMTYHHLPFLHINSLIVFGLITGVGYLMLRKKKADNDHSCSDLK